MDRRARSMHLPCASRRSCTGGTRHLGFQLSKSPRYAVDQLDVSFQQEEAFFKEEERRREQRQRSLELRRQERQRQRAAATKTKAARKRAQAQRRRAA